MIGDRCSVGELLKALEGRDKDEAVCIITYGKTLYNFRVKPYDHKVIPICIVCRKRTPWCRSNICLGCLELNKEALMKDAFENCWGDVIDRIGGSYKRPFVVIKQYGGNLISWKRTKCPNCVHIFELLTSARYEVCCVKCNYQSEIQNKYS